MRVIRSAVFQRKGWLFWACILALAVRMLVPSGYMPTQVNGVPTIAICDGTGVHMMTLPGMAGAHHDQDKRADSSCPFAVAAMASLGNVDAIVLRAPVLAPLVVGVIFGQPNPRLRTARLRPPAQGPPTL